MEPSQYAAPLCVRNHRFNNNAETHFQDIFQSLQKLIDCTYLFYMFENKNISKRITFSTNQEWQSIYVNDNLIVHCPLLYVGRHQMNNSPNKSTILRWNDIIPDNKSQQNVMGIRSEFNIANGISFAKEFYNIREMIGIAADTKNLSFTQDVILNMNAFNGHLLKLRHVAIAELNQQSWLPSVFHSNKTLH